MGTIKAVVAVLDIKLVNTAHSTNTTKVRTMGEGFSPKAPITWLAIISPAPVEERADARERVPPNRKGKSYVYMRKL